MEGDGLNVPVWYLVRETFTICERERGRVGLRQVSLVSHCFSARVLIVGGLGCEADLLPEEEKEAITELFSLVSRSSLAV